MFNRDGPATKKRILAVVADQPAVTVSEVCRQLNLAWNTVGHHLRSLVQDGSILQHNNGWSTELYPGELSEQVCLLLRALHNQNTAKVMRGIHAVKPQAVGVYALSDHLGLSRKVVLKHVNQLVTDRLVEKLGESRPRYRSLVVDMPQAL